MYATDDTNNDAHIHYLFFVQTIDMKRFSKRKIPRHSALSPLQRRSRSAVGADIKSNISIYIKYILKGLRARNDAHRLFLTYRRQALSIRCNSAICPHIQFKTVDLTLQKFPYLHHCDHSYSLAELISCVGSRGRGGLTERTRRPSCRLGAFF